MDFPSKNERPLRSMQARTAKPWNKGRSRRRRSKIPRTNQMRTDHYPHTTDSPPLLPRPTETSTVRHPHLHRPNRLHPQFKPETWHRVHQHPLPRDPPHQYDRQHRLSHRAARDPRLPQRRRRRHDLLVPFHLVDRLPEPVGGCQWEWPDEVEEWEWDSPGYRRVCRPRWMRCPDVRPPVQEVLPVPALKRRPHRLRVHPIQLPCPHCWPRPRKPITSTPQVPPSARSPLLQSCHRYTTEDHRFAHLEDLAWE